MEDLRRHQLGTLSALAQAIDERSSWTLGHSGRVARLSQRIAKEMGVPPEETRKLHRAALLHNIGKLKLSTAILEKPGPLTSDERRQVEEHVDAGVRILAPIPEYSAIRLIVAQHHERLDGSGYARGLTAAEIHRCAGGLYDPAVVEALNAVVRQGGLEATASLEMRTET